MVTLYKLTNKNCETQNNTKWGEGITNNTDGIGELCSSGWIHAYLSPELAILLNPIHANFSNPILWEAEGEVGKTDGQLKVGCKSLTTIRKLSTPVISTEQKIKFAILCAKAVYNEPKFIGWADNWLSGSDRSKSTAQAAEAATWTARAAARTAEAAAQAAEAATWMARAAEEAKWTARAAAQAAQAAQAAEAATWTARAAEAAEAKWTAEAAARAAEAAARAAKPLDLIAITKEALK